MSVHDDNKAENQWPERLRRRVASEYLRKTHGLEAAPATLAKLAVTGGGPEYDLWGRIPYYPIEKLDEWVMARLSRRSPTSDRAEERQRADRLGDADLANSGDLESPIEENSAGILRQHKMGGHPPGTPVYQIEVGFDSEAHQARNKNAEKSSAREGRSRAGRSGSWGQR